MLRNIAQLLLELLDVCVCTMNCAVWTSSAIYNVSQTFARGLINWIWRYLFRGIFLEHICLLPVS